MSTMFSSAVRLRLSVAALAPRRSSPAGVEPISIILTSVTASFVTEPIG